jgi:methyl-accepting chemotaxis protein
MRFPIKKQLTLAAKFNILTIALILGTSLGITLFVVRQQVTHNYAELVNRGVSIATMVSQSSEYTLYTEDQKSLGQLVDGISADENVAYVSILNAGNRVLASKAKDKGFRIPDALRTRKDGAGGVLSKAFTEPATGKRYIDIVAPVVSQASPAASAVDSLDLGFGMEQPAQTGPKTIGYVQIGLSQEGLRKRIRAFLVSTLLVTLLIVLAGTGLTVLLTRRIAAPIHRLVRVARDISEGKLDHRIEHDGTVEIAALAGAIQNMSGNLRDMIGKISGLASRVSQVAADITDSPASVLRVVDIQKKAVEEAVRAISEVNASTAAISGSTESLTASAREASSATVQLTGSVSTVAEHAGVFDATAQEAASSVEEMVASIREIAGHLDALLATSEETSAALTEINSTIREIQQNAEESVRYAERVSLDASEKGMGAVKASLAGIEHVRESVGRLEQVINGLGQRSQEIGTIVKVIDEVAEQTSLLALNASILAAQAGQYGNSFAVVAGEIKGLAERTSGSTREIAKLISSVQAEVKASVRMAAEGAQAADEGVKLVQGVNAALKGIEQGAAISTDMSRAIQRATVEEAKVIKNITDAVREQAKQIEQISASTREQTKGSRLIMEAIEKVKTGSHEVKAATAEQVDSSRRISAVSENVSTHSATRSRRATISRHSPAESRKPRRTSSPRPRT